MNLGDPVWCLPVILTFGPLLPPKHCPGPFQPNIFSILLQISRLSPKFLDHCPRFTPPPPHNNRMFPAAFMLTVCGSFQQCESTKKHRFDCVIVSSWIRIWPIFMFTEFSLSLHCLAIAPNFACLVGFASICTVFDVSSAPPNSFFTN